MKRPRKSRRKRILRTAANYLAWALARLVLFGLERSPFRAAHALGRLAGLLGFHLAGQERRRALRHLARAFPERSALDRRRLARRSFENMAVSACTALVLPRLPERLLRRHVHNYDDYMRRLDRLMAGGRGFIALTGHLGNWESLAALGARRFPCNVVANRLGFEPFNRLLERMRTAAGLRIIYLSESPRSIVRALERGEIVGLLPDQDIRFLPGVFVDFFGEPAWTPVGPVLVARLSGAPLVPFFLLHEGRGFRAAWTDPVPMVFTGQRRRDLQANTERWSRVIEDTVRRHPDQWAWNHRRWKTRPGDPRAGLR